MAPMTPMTPMAETTPALAVAGVSHDFGGRRVLDNVTFNVRPGDFTVLLGLNGAGKTTLFSLITRLYAHRSGSIRIFGDAIDVKPGRALAAMGVVFQQTTLDLELNVRQNLAYHAALHGLERGYARRRIAEELQRGGLAAEATRKTRHLSGGQRRRIEIARALLHSPRLLLLDEATAGLDVASRKAMRTHVQNLCRRNRLAVLWATHLLDETPPDGRIVILHKGRVRADSTFHKVAGATGQDALARTFAKLTHDATP